jgi:prolyl-tRNA editing enzyme YbaK/EbsC (Cys-tRNA(Pro) deacylase)
MSLQSVREFFQQHAPDIEVILADASTATVPEAAAVHGVNAGQIAKTLSLWLRDEVILLVMGGDARVDNRKFKERFGAKPRLLKADEVVEHTGHPVGGVCPFGLPRRLSVFLDESLRRFEEVLPAAGETFAAVRIEPDRLARLVIGEWVDIAELRSGQAQG